jgi:uncharacterized membrane protein YdcZ (DUF606 family)
MEVLQQTGQRQACIASNHSVGIVSVYLLCAHVKTPCRQHTMKTVCSFTYMPGVLGSFNTTSETTSLLHVGAVPEGGINSSNLQNT